MLSTKKAAISTSTVTRSHPNATPRSGEFTAPQQTRPQQLVVPRAFVAAAHHSLPTGRAEPGPHSTAHGASGRGWRALLVECSSPDGLAEVWGAHRSNRQRSRRATDGTTPQIGNRGGRMARPMRSVVVPTPLRPAKSHLIEEYNARTNIVRCDCGWAGNADEFAVHRRAVGASSPS